MQLPPKSTNLLIGSSVEITTRKEHHARVNMPSSRRAAPLLSDRRDGTIAKIIITLTPKRLACLGVIFKPRPTEGGYLPIIDHEFKPKAPKSPPLSTQWRTQTARSPSACYKNIQNTPRNHFRHKTDEGNIQGRSRERADEWCERTGY